MNDLFKLDSESALLEPEFHDGLLRGILVDSNATLAVTCTDESRKKEYVLRVPKINSLVVDNFRQGNIIFNIFLFEGRQASRALIARAMDVGDAEGQKVVERMKEQICQENWVTIHITTSYGCELFGISQCSLTSIEIVRTSA